ncbi:3-phosphoserine/phosphohydroxythreonine transaminase [Geopsychrobacter electrodiphilus]|uniref:3-phosphoserine/phosphohydroxythreonine transaminase n=1 Tax=Geopsychrobacter electrodiphilus TaxID=225196 RepID=UPI00035E1E28|nr:3-phosphoserine/phosphohydroxythreonine transaminase [Geopsychrobacter electrodiphilus]
MTQQVYNFGAGPAMLPLEVMQQIREEWLDYRGMGVSVIEISHRCEQFDEIITSTQKLFRELTGLPDNYRILFMHGGARMQFAAVPMNLAGRVTSRKALYCETGNFAKIAAKDAAPFAAVKTIISGADSGYTSIPALSSELIEQDAAYLHLTSNNTLYGTRWNNFPDGGDVPLIADMTSELLSRQIDFSKFGLVFAGLQKNLGPSGMAMVIVRDDLLEHAGPQVPILMNYQQCARDNSLTNTTNTFAIYAIRLVLEWQKKQGGIAAIEQRNLRKSALLYALLDESDFYTGVAHPDHRSTMNVTFRLPTEALEDRFVAQAEADGLYALAGHRSVGGIRASIYNPMPEAGVQKLVDFMRNFMRTQG